jgi:hypothetical protein
MEAKGDKPRSRIEVVKHVWWVALLNFLAKILFCCACFRKYFELSPRALMRTARFRAEKGIPPLDENIKLSPEGKTDTPEETRMLKYSEALTALTDDLQKHDTTCMGQLFLHGVYSNILSTRMQVIHFIRQNYDAINAQEIKRPVIVVGLPRTGTTITYNLLSANPDFRYAPNWQALCPTLSEKAAKRQVMIGMTLATTMEPSVNAVHEMGVDHPEECVFFMQPMIACWLNLSFAPFPNFTQYIKEKADPAALYRWHKYYLQILQLRYPAKVEGKVAEGKEAEGKRWVLKTPIHLAYLDELLKTYPDACIVWTHRDVTNAVSSLASLCKHFNKISAKQVDPDYLGKQSRTILSHWLRQATTFRRANPQFAKNFYDISYSKIVADPLAAVAEIYKHFDIPYTDHIQECTAKKFKHMPQGKFGVHKYSPQDFGLTKEDILRDCAEYVEEYSKYF